MRPTIVSVLVGLAGLSVVQLGAHHAVGRVYDVQRTVTIEGAVMRIVNKSPHPVVDLVVEDNRGGTHTWAIEFDSVFPPSTAVTRAGLLLPGDRLTVCGNPGRDPGVFRLRMLKLERQSDGMSLRRELGVSPSQCAR